MPLILENSDEAIELERLIDAHGLHNVLAAIEDICNGKAEHVRTNWQDRDLARVWEANARLMDKARSKIIATN